MRQSLRERCATRGSRRQELRVALEAEPPLSRSGPRPARPASCGGAAAESAAGGRPPWQADEPAARCVETVAELAAAAPRPGLSGVPLAPHS